MIKERRLVLPIFYFPISQLVLYAFIMVLLGFLAGSLTTFLFMTRTLDHAVIEQNYANIEQKIAQVGQECARPQTGQVTVTSNEIVDAISGKELEFVVETTTN